MKVIWQVQKAIHDSLIDNTKGLSPLVDVFHSVPDNTKTPYITINDIKAENISDFSNEVYRLNIKINAFNDELSNNSILSTMEDIKRVILSIDDLHATDYEFIEVMQKDAFVKLIEDSKIWHGLVSFEFYVKGK